MQLLLYISWVKGKTGGKKNMGWSVKQSKVQILL